MDGRFEYLNLKLQNIENEISDKEQLIDKFRKIRDQGNDEVKGFMNNEIEKLMVERRSLLRNADVIEEKIAGYSRYGSDFYNSVYY